jgi:hypothetical protein
LTSTNERRFQLDELQYTACTPLLHVLIWHKQQRSHESIDWLPNQLRKSICFEGNPIWSMLVVIV